MGNSRLMGVTKIKTTFTSLLILSGGLAIVGLAENNITVKNINQQYNKVKTHVLASFGNTEAIKEEVKSEEPVEEIIETEEVVKEEIITEEETEVVEEIIEEEINYNTNYIDSWTTIGSYSITPGNGTTFIEYNNLKDFELISANVYNYNNIYNTLLIDLGNIGSVENITVNVVDENGITASKVFDLSKYNNKLYTISFDYKEANPNINIVTRIELLIDSNPLEGQADRMGHVEIISSNFIR